MEVTKFEHGVISNFFSSYDRGKSSILCATMAGDISEYFCAHIYRKGKFEFKKDRKGIFRMKKL